MNIVHRLSYYFCNQNFNITNIFNPYMNYYISYSKIEQKININKILISIKSNYKNEKEIINNIDNIFDINDILSINYEKIYNIKNRIIKNLNNLNPESIIYYIEFNDTVSRKTFKFLNYLTNIHKMKYYNFEIKITNYNENRNFNFN